MCQHPFLYRPIMTTLFEYRLHWLSHYHNESFCDAVLAAVAVLSIAGPVVFLTVELSLFLIVPLTQDTATFTAPMMRGGKQRRGPVKVRSDRKLRMQSKVTVTVKKTKQPKLLKHKQQWNTAIFPTGIVMKGCFITYHKLLCFHISFAALKNWLLIWRH